MKDIGKIKARLDGSYKGWGKKNASKIRRNAGKNSIRRETNWFTAMAGKKPVKVDIAAVFAAVERLK